MGINEAAEILAKKYSGGASSPVVKGSNPNLPDRNLFQLFTDSMYSALTSEMAGHEASPEVKQFREAQPELGAISEYASPVGAYVGVARAGKAIPKVAKFLDKVGDANTLAGNAKRNAVLFGGTIEAPRTIAAAATGGDLEETATSAAVNTGLELTLGGLGGAFRAAGKAMNKKLKLGAELDLKKSPQEIAQVIRQQLADGKISGDDVHFAQSEIGKLEDAIRNEALDDTAARYIKELEDGDAQPLNRLFKISTTPQQSPISRKRFRVEDFTSPQELESVMQTAGLKDKLSYVQFPRYIASADESGAKAVESSLKQGGLKAVAPNVLMGKEKDGLYVIAKKLEGDVGKTNSGDKWALFKTSDPSHFAPDGAKWGEQVRKSNAWKVIPDRKIDPNNPLDIMDEAQQLADAMPIHGYYQATKGLGRGMDSLEKMVGLEGESELMKRLKGSFRENFAPAAYEFKNSPRAQWLFAQAKTTFSKAEAMAHAMTYGDEVVKGGTNMYKQILANTDLSGKFGTGKSFAKILEPLEQADIDDLVKAADMGLEGESLNKALASNMISKKAYDALKEIQPLDDYMIKQTLGTLDAVGHSGFTPIKAHYLLPRTWKGDWRVPIRNESNKLIYMASGKDRAAALAEADKILAEAEAKNWKRLEPIVADSADDIALALDMAVGSPEYMTAAALKYKILKQTPNPKTFKVRTGVGGYEKQFTKEELVSKFYSNILQRNRHLAELTNKKVLEDQMVKLSLEDVQLSKQLERRMAAMAGKQGAVGKLINHEVDKILSPVLGKNSASKIASTLNEVNHHLTLGAFKLAFPVMNMMTFMQTVLPRVAFTLSATDESLAHSYSWLPLIGTDKKVRGSMGYLDPMKIMARSFKEMGNMDDALARNYAKAQREGVVDPKFIEEWGGKTSKQVTNLRAVLSGEEGFGSFLKAISNYLPTQSEKLSRGNAFTVGHIVGRDALKLSDDALYRFAKEFTEKTMYNYSAADRPRIFTGPLGQVFGQFKTWQSNYIANMLEYAGEGFNYNNWSPLLYQMGGTTALGGISATALYPIADNMAQFLSDKSMMEVLYERTGGGSGDAVTGNMTDAVFHGLPMFLGTSMSGMASDPLSDPSRTASMLFSFVQAQRAQALGKAVGQAIDDWKITGQHPIQSAETRNAFIQALAPVTMARAMSLTQNQAIKSLNNGNQMYPGLNAAERIMYATGFMPKRVALMKDVNEELWKDQEALRKKVQTFGRMWSEAELAGDYGMLTDLQRKIYTEGIPMDSVLRSAKGQTKNALVPQMQRQFKPADVMRFQSLGIVE